LRAIAQHKGATTMSDTPQLDPSKPPDAYGQPISAERQAELQGYLDRWAAETDHGERKGPFDQGLDQYGSPRVKLTGADVSWLAERSRRRDGSGGIELGVPNLHLEGAGLSGANLEGAGLSSAHLEGAHLTWAQLKGANIHSAHLEGASLRLAHLEHASLSWSKLEGADLSEAHLEGTHLSEAHLEGADLRGAFLDETTILTDAILGPGLLGRWLDRFRFRNRYAALGDIKWRDADLTAVPWERVVRLGDERRTNLFGLFGDPYFEDFISPDPHRAVVRAYRQVATRLREQGMAEAADRFAYRAQIRQRGVLLRTFRLPQYLFSWILALLAGYGYRPGRTLFWYLVTVIGFAYLYMQITQGWVPFGLPSPSQLAPLPWYEALILSVSSFHGRGFFQPLQSLGDPVAALAAIEAVIGLFIEISFIATFTQRFFGAK
jgi:uncharacterized protein YjbI with pentapeptide repeats